MKPDTTTAIKTHSPSKRTGGLEAFKNLLSNLNQSGQRLLLSVIGSHQQFEAALEAAAISDAVFWISDQVSQGLACPRSRLFTRLGEEYPYLVYGARQTLDADTLCMAQGLLCSGGALLLWFDKQPSASQSCFADYVWEHLKTGMPCWNIETGQWINHQPNLADSKPAGFERGMSRDQLKVFTKLSESLNTSDWTAITADRGRGKSFLLGQLAQQFRQQGLSVVLTAPSKRQVKVALQQLDDFDCFKSPDALLQASVAEIAAIDLLLIDEAAMLPYSLLLQLKQRFKCAIVATTTGGYEGTGQGFRLRFLQQFALQSLRLTQPIRWGENDYLEHWFNRVMMLDSAPQNDSLTAPLTVAKNSCEIEYCSVEKAELFSSPYLLNAVYRLLTDAHYRTSPADLQQLLDDKSQKVFIARISSQIVAVTVVVEEGGLDAALTEAVFMGTRRPRGHLLAQMVTAQAGSRRFAQYRGWRIQRIAVMQSGRRQGIGLGMLKFVQQQAESARQDYLGSSFAMQSDVIQFWQRAGYSCVHLSQGRGVSSGRASLVVLRPLNSELRETVLPLQHKFFNSLPLFLARKQTSLYWQDVMALIQALKDAQYPLPQIIHDEVEAFAFGFKGFDLSLYGLQQWLLHNPQLLKLPTDSSQQLLIESVFLQLSSSELYSRHALSGKKQWLASLRKIFKSMWQARINNTDEL